MGHERVGGGRLDGDAEPGPVDEPPETDHEQKGRGDHRQLEPGEGNPGKHHGLLRKHLGEDPVPRPHGDHHEVLQEDGGAEGTDQRRQLGGIPERPVADPLQVIAEQGAQQGSQGQHGENEHHQVRLEKGYGRKDGDEDEAEIGADHVDLAMGEVDQLQHPVHQGIAEGDQGVAAADGDAVEEMLKEHGTPVKSEK